MARAFGLDKGITVAVAANPGAEVNDVWNGGLIELQSVDIAERFNDFVVDARQAIEE